MGRKMLSHQQFVDRVKTTSPDVTILGQYTGASNRIKVKCNKCGNEWNVIANSLIQGSGCNKCKPIFNKITHDEFMQKLDNKGILEKIEILSTYKTVKDRIKCKCKICGHIWNPMADYILRGNGCPKCGVLKRSSQRKYTNEQFLSKLHENNMNIRVLSQYVDSYTKVKCQCEKCGNIWKARANHLLSGHGCPICKSSLGEKKIFNYLTKNNVLFIHQKTFGGLLGLYGGLLPYDFYLPNQNLLIEYQGQFHDGTVSGDLQSEKEYKLRQEYDKRKREYARKRNIRLLEIWYYDFDNILKIIQDNIDMRKEDKE